MGDNNDDDWDDVCVPIPVEKILALQEKDKEPIRLAVEEVLLPSLQGEALHLGREIVERFGAYKLYLATEAVSSFLTDYLIQNPTRQIIMDHFGDITIMDDWRLLFTCENLVYAVARFTDLWTETETQKDDYVYDLGLQPAKGLSVVVCWMWTALKYQPRLLPHFVATVPEAVPYVFLLTKVDAKERIDDPRQRWRRSPSKQS